MRLEITYHEKQLEIISSRARFKVVAKGRRFGFTKMLSNYVIQKMLEKSIKVLWVDTIYLNIERYVERYFFEVLRNLDRKYWRWRSIKNELRILESVCDFRSADRPQNMEGFGYHLIVINEAGIVLKNRKIYEESIAPMILDYGAEVIIGGTPKGKRHKSKGKSGKHLFYELFEKGVLSSKQTKDGIRNYELRIKNKNSKTNSKANETSWMSFQYSTYDNEILKKSEIKNLESEMDKNLAKQEIYGNFIDSELDSIIKREWWRFYDTVELKLKVNYGIYQSWDTAFKTNEENDYTVCTTWEITNDGYYLIDIWRGRLEFPELKRKVVEKGNQFRVNEILIEDHASGQSLIQELNRNTRLAIKPIKKDKDKLSYVYAVTPLIESGKVLLPIGLKENEKLEELISECEDFPNGEFDDIVDSITQFLNYAKNLQTGSGEIFSIKRKRKKYY